MRVKVRLTGGIVSPLKAFHQSGMVKLMKRALTILPLFVSSLVIAQAPAAPQAAPQKANLPAFRETVEVRVMDLDVAVTDSKGRPVGDLKKEDFVVKIDGQTVPIDYFTRIEEGTIHAPDLASASPERVLAEYRKGPDAYVPRHFLMYFDIGSLSQQSRKRGLDALRDLVDRFGPSDTARVVSFDRQPTILLEWTSSKEDILAALSKIENAGVGMSRLINEQMTLNEIDSTPRRGRSAQNRAFLARSYAEQEHSAVQILLKDMNAELSTVAPLPGKKAFVYVSGGFDMQPGYAMSQYAIGTFSLNALDVPNMSPELDAIVKRANTSDVTFYSLDARGLTAPGGTASNDDPLLARPGVAFIARQDSQAGLLDLAKQTGGLAFTDTNSLKNGIAQVYEDASTYYSLGVNLSKLPGTGYRKVDVSVTRSGLTVRSRRGFAPRTRTDRGKDMTQATLRSNAQYNAIPVDLRIAKAEKAKKYYELPILITVPASSLTFVPTEKGGRATAVVYIGAIDDKGYTSEVGFDQANFDLPNGAPPDTPLKYQTKLTIRKGNMRIAVNVQDNETGRMGTAKADVHVQ
jgi:VWFA-related protein